MVRTEAMPKSIQSDISVDAVGEALLKHYNVGIRNPWFEIGRSDQETYNRRKLPWAGKSYSVDQNGNVSGPNVEELPDSLTDRWAELASAARTHLAVGEGGFGDLETMFEEGLTAVAQDLSS